jgi:enoyl-CoA hydratase
MDIRSRDAGNGVRTLVLDGPPVNAIDLDFLGELASVVDAAEGDGNVRAVILTGSGTCFSAGLDLKAMAAGQASGMAGLGGADGADGMFRLWTLRKPTVAMINGHAIAGGCLLALACDFRIMSAGSHRIGLNETAIGVALPTGAFEIARLAVPTRSAREVLLGAALYEPDAARAVGLVDEVVEAAELERACVERARTLGAFPGPAYAANKFSWQRLAVERVRTEPEELRERIREAWASEETQQAFAARFASLAKSKG